MELTLNKAGSRGFSINLNKKVIEQYGWDNENVIFAVDLFRTEIKLTKKIKTKYYYKSYKIRKDRRKGKGYKLTIPQDIVRICRFQPGQKFNAIIDKKNIIITYSP